MTHFVLHSGPNAIQLQKGLVYDRVGCSTIPPAVFLQVNAANLEGLRPPFSDAA